MRSTFTSRYRRIVLAGQSVIAAMSLAFCAGCGGFLVDGGIFPLPTVHFITVTPTDYGMSYEQLEIKSSNGQPLFSWFIPAENAKGAILIDHGAFFNRSLYLSHCKLFHDLGYHVLVFDYQGFGESYVLARIDTILDDANAALAYLQQRPEPGTDKIVIFGISMGSMVALAQAAENPEGVVGVILEGTVQQRLLPDLAYLVLGILPSPESFAEIPPELDPFNNVGRVSLPKLFLQSLEDDVTPFSGAQMLFDMAVEPKSLIKLVGTHGLSIAEDPGYPDYLKVFLEAVTREE